VSHKNHEFISTARKLLYLQNIGTLKFNTHLLSKNKGNGKLLFQWGKDALEQWPLTSDKHIPVGTLRHL
jgi:hypothetical protein